MIRCSSCHDFGALEVGSSTTEIKNTVRTVLDDVSHTNVVTKQTTHPTVGQRIPIRIGRSDGKKEVTVELPNRAGLYLKPVEKHLRTLAGKSRRVSYKGRTFKGRPPHGKFLLHLEVRGAA